MSNPEPALRDDVANARNRRGQGVKDDLAHYCMRMIQEHDRHEQERRRYDRIGGNIYYSRHWNTPMPEGRSAITCNVSKTLIDHKVSIQTKQQPFPIVECADGGDPIAARFMRSSIMDWWDRTDMQTKLEQAELLGACTRTAAIKYLWDDSLYGGAGDIDADVIPGWRLIIDPLARDRKRVRYIGDRALTTRAKAMKMYPKYAEEIKNSVGPQQFETSGTAQSPIKDPWSRMVNMYPGVAAINGLWTLAGYSSTGINTGGTAQDIVEIAELYYKDPTLVTVTRRQKDDESGEPVQRIVRDDDGVPQFEMTHREAVTLEDGSVATVPRFKLQLEDMMVEEDVDKYPFYRRTTILMPDCIVIDDDAWDYPHPYSLHGDGEVLEGLWKKGVLLELEDLQAQLNVSLSIMMDNLRFSSYRVGVAYEGAQLERNALSVNPGDIINVMGPKESLQFIQFPEVSQAWFTWIKNIVEMMQQIVGVTGVMQGETAGRVDSTSGYDLLSEIAGSRITKDTQRMERSIGDGMEIVGAMMQDSYTPKHGIKVERSDGNVAFYRVMPQTLQGAFRYRVLTGSTLAWSESARRARVLDDFQQGLRDKISVWQELNFPNWRDIMHRMQAEGGFVNTPPPPQRTRQTPPKIGAKQPAAPRGAHGR